MSPVDPVLAHVLSQIQGNVDFLVQNDYISQHQAAAISAALPTPNQAPAPTPAPAFPTPAGRPPVPSQPEAVQARATWGYNENNEVRALE